MPRCSECRKNKPVTEFHQRSARPRRYHCKSCGAARSARHWSRISDKDEFRRSRRRESRHRDSPSHFYVYVHKCPDSGEVVYVGRGINKRAWEINGGKRKPDHVEWLKGKDVLDVVRITHRKLSWDEALDIEWRMLKRHNPRFNRIGPHAHVGV